MPTIRRALLCAAFLLVPSLAHAQAGLVTLIKSSVEPLPNCTPAVQGQLQPQLWDVTAQQMVTCTGVNVWSAMAGGGGGSGTVTLFSVSGSTNPFFTTNVATPTTTPQLQFTITPQVAHCVFAGPASGGATIPTCRNLGATDLPVILLANTPLTSAGDVLTVSGGVLARLGLGGANTFLGNCSGSLGFCAPAGAGTVLNSGTLTASALMLGFGGTTITALGSLGTTTTVLHGNAAGNPSFGPVNFATDGTGNIPIANICSGTGASATTFLRGDCSWTAPSVLWQNIGSATGNATFNNAGNSTTFNQTSAITWTWANVTAAVHLTPQNSPIESQCGTYFNGAASAVDCWSMQTLLGTADNGVSTYAITHSGSSGGGVVNVPSLTTGSAAVSLCAGITGCFAATEASTLPTPTSGVDFLQANSTNHCIEASFNGASFGCLPTTSPIPVQVFSSSVLGSDTAISANTLTTVLTLSVTMPASGCPCRALVSYWIYWLTSAPPLSVDFYVSDGSQAFAASQSAVNSSSAGDNGASGTASSFSTVTYANGANVTFSVLTKGNAAYTAKIASLSGSGPSSSMQAAIIPSN